MKIIKRNGSEVEFDATKIRVAMSKAFKSVDEGKGVSDEVIASLTAKAVKTISRIPHTVNVEEVQDIVEDVLMDSGYHNVARSYITYRFTHAVRRNTTDAAILSLIEAENEEVKQENSNKNPTVASVQRDYMAGEVSKDLTRRVLLPPDIVKAHDEGIIHFHDMDYYSQHIMNCFGSKTRFVTGDGVRAFKDCKDGEEVVVLDKDGNWRTATVHKYGRQTLWDVTLRAGRTRKTITCTRDHRWVLRDGSVTTNLQVGDSLYLLPHAKVNDVPVTKRDCQMFCFGMVIGDGSNSQKGVNIRLCGEKIKYRQYFERAGFGIWSSEDSKDVFGHYKEFNKQDFLNVSGWKYLSQRDKEMLFIGYYAADGCYDRNHCHTADERILNMILDISAVAGYHIMTQKRIVHDTPFKKGAVLYDISFAKHQHCNRPWKVEEIVPHRSKTDKQDVWCVEEPVTRTFTLDGGIVTGNCCLINLDDMLQNGTVISGTLIERPHRFSTACNIATQIIAQVASCQYGGQSISLTHLAKFVDVSRQAIRKEVEAENKEAVINMTEYQMNEVVERRLRKEIRAGIQTIQYQVITLMTTNGQAPFITMLLYLDEAGRDETLKHDLAICIEETLRQRYEGVKNEAGVWITPAFPKLIYVLDEDNIHPDSPYFYLTKLAAKCTAKRMVPDYISAKKMREYKLSKGETEGHGDVYTCMGCRSFLTPDRSGNGWDNIANAKNNDGKPKYYGRFNQGVVTINLPDVALSSDGDMDKFWEIFDERLELCHRALQCRHKRLEGTLSDVSPIHWQYGALARLGKGEKIDKLLHGGYSTISLGYAGLYECCKYMTGKSHTDPEAKPFALQVMQHMNDKCAEWKAAEDIDYSLYGTPLESTTYKFAKCLDRRFGKEWEKISGDKNYITNSYHVHVTEKIDAFTKLKFESDFQKLSPGGAISYVEVPNMQDNLEAVIKVMQFIYENIMYAELNTKSDYCQVCGYDGEIQIVEDDGKLVWECPKCHNRDQNKLNVARRTCGYIGTQFWNQGRTQEIKDRVLHL